MVWPGTRQFQKEPAAWVQNHVQGTHTPFYCRCFKGGRKRIASKARLDALPTTYLFGLHERAALALGLGAHLARRCIGLPL